MDKQTYLGISSAAKILGISVDTLRRWSCIGKITVYRDNGSVRTPHDKGKDRYFYINDLLYHAYNRRITTLQAANILGVSRSKVRRMEQSGLLVPDRAENGWREYKRQDIYDLMRTEGQPFLVK